MTFLAAIRLALGTLLAHKGRSFLTSLGIIIGIGAGYGVKGAVDASKLSGGVSAEDAQNLKLSGAAKVYVSGVKYGGFFGVIRNPDERAGKGAWNLIFGLNVLTNRIAGGP